MNDVTDAPKRSALPKRNPPDKDNVMTPPDLVWQIFCRVVQGGETSIHDPCAGDGAFVTRAEQIFGTERVTWNENRVGALRYNGTDFFQHTQKHALIISNPPYSLLTPWLKHSFTLADNVVYLIQAPAPFFTARRRVAKEAGFRIREMHYVNAPEEWTKEKITFGGGLAAVWWQRGWEDGISETYADDFVFPKEQNRGGN